MMTAAVLNLVVLPVLYEMIHGRVMRQNDGGEGE
jgi:Cu/Ag efflux pump CusA